MINHYLVLLIKNGVQGRCHLKRIYFFLEPSLYDFLVASLSNVTLASLLMFRVLISSNIVWLLIARTRFANCNQRDIVK